jgi:predicted small metal-binding protein
VLQIECSCDKCAESAEDGRRRHFLWEVHMAKVFECGSVVPGCESVLHAQDASELMIRAVEHMRSTHEIEHVSEHLVTRIRSVIKDERPRK